MQRPHRGEGCMPRVFPLQITCSAHVTAWPAAVDMCLCYASIQHMSQCVLHGPASRVRRLVSTQLHCSHCSARQLTPSLRAADRAPPSLPPLHREEQLAKPWPPPRTVARSGSIAGLIALTRLSRQLGAAGSGKEARGRGRPKLDRPVHKRALPVVRELGAAAAEGSWETKEREEDWRIQG